MPHKSKNNQTPVQMKEKPWGREIWFAHTEKYAGKILEVKKSARLSLQYHEQKCETIYVFEGKIKLTHGKDQKKLNHKILNPGDKFDIFPYTIHRIEGLKDSKLFEVSTPELDDVIKLADDYGRNGKGNNEELDRKLAKEFKKKKT
jgi:mannose-6-phosphate isomerase